MYFFILNEGLKLLKYQRTLLSREFSIKIMWFGLYFPMYYNVLFYYQEILFLDWIDEDDSSLICIKYSHSFFRDVSKEEKFLNAPLFNLSLFHLTQIVSYSYSETYIFPFWSPYKNFATINISPTSPPLPHSYSTHYNTLRRQFNHLY